MEWSQLTITEHKQLLPLTDSDLCQQRKQIVRHALRVLAHNPARVATRRIEVSQQRAIPLFSALARLLRNIPLRVHKVRDHILHCKLRIAVRVRRPQRALLRNRYHILKPRRIPIHRRGAREDDVRYMVLLHAAQQAQRAVDVDLVVVQRDLAALADGLEGGEVDDIVDVRVLGEDLVELRLVGDVAGVVLGPLAADELDAVEHFGGRVVEVVHNDNLVVRFEKGERGEGADVAGATGKRER